MSIRPDQRLMTLALVLTLGVMPIVPAEAVASRAAEELVGAAIVGSVAERIGGSPRVTVRLLQAGYSGSAAVTAKPEPGARTGSPARFVLYEQGRRVGVAVATADVNVRHLRAERALVRLEPLSAGDFKVHDGPLVDELIRRVPVAEDVVGSRVRRNIAAGEAITASVIEVAPLVRSGDRVTVIVRVGAVEAESQGVASGSGHEGDVIRVAMPGSKRLRPAQIVGPRTVEVVR
jgi:flagella basal body P-ring formation protein FlgA